MSLQHLSHVQMKLIKVHLTKLNFVVNGKTNNQNKYCWFGLLFSKPMREIDLRVIFLSWQTPSIQPLLQHATTSAPTLPVTFRPHWYFIPHLWLLSNRLSHDKGDYTIALSSQR